MGLYNGTALVEITNPTSPVVIGHIPGNGSMWHENVVLGNYCYSVNDGNNGGGIQIIDLNNVDSGVVTLAATYNGVATGQNLTKVHTIDADDQTKRLFANGTNRGFVVYDANNPTTLVELGRWTNFYVHDMVVRNFPSPVAPFYRQIAYLCCGVNGLYIVDITNPGAMVTLGSTPVYAGAGNNTYCHSAALTPDARYLLINDEFDENRNLTSSATTVIIDVQNLTAPVKIASYLSGINTIDHNSHLRDGSLFLSAYKAGMRVYNCQNPLAMFETGYIDTYPGATDDLSYNGNWGVYALFPSRTVVLSDIDSGFFVADPTEAAGFGTPILNLVLDKPSAGDSTIKTARYSDDQRNTINATGRRFTGLTSTHQTTYSPRSTVAVAVEGQGAGEMRVHLKNYTTGVFDRVATGELSGTDQVFGASGLPASTYTNAAGESQVRIEIKNGTNAPFLCDMIRVTVSR